MVMLTDGRGHMRASTYNELRCGGKPAEEKKLTRKEREKLEALRARRRALEEQIESIEEKMKKVDLEIALLTDAGPKFG